MTLEEFAEHLERETEIAVREAVQFAAQQIRELTPSQMTQTRAAVFSRSNKLDGIVGLRFRRQYDAAGTNTQKRLRRQWLTIRPLIRKRFIERLNDALKGI